MKAPALVLVVLFVLSVVVGISNASALSAVSFTTKASITSANQQFQRLYENGTSSIIALDGSATNGTYYKRAYSIVAGTASSSTTTLSGSGNTVNADAFASPVDLSRYSLLLNGATQYAQASANTVFDVTTQDFSLWGFFYRTSDSGGTEYIAIKRDPSLGTQNGYHIQIDSTDHLAATIRRSPNGASATSTSTISTNTWYFFAASFARSGNLTLYLYNMSTGAYETATASISTASGSITNTQTFTVGRNAASSASFFPGRIDHLNVLIGTAITAQNVQDLILNPDAITPTSRFDFNDGVGSIAEDIVGSNDLTLVNSPTWSSVVPTTSPSRPTTYITGRDTTTGKNGYAKLNLSDLSKVSDNYQTSSYHPKDIAQSTTKLYSPLYNGSASTYGTLKLGIIGRDFTSYSEPTIYTGTSGAPAYSILANVTSSLGGSTAVGGSITATVVTEKFTSTAALIGTAIDGLQFVVSKNNSPTGTAVIGTFDSSGNVVTTFGTVDVSTLSSSAAIYNIRLTKPYIIQTNDRIGIKFTGGDASNFIRVFWTNGNLYDGQNAYQSNYISGSWSDDSAPTSADRSFAIIRATAKIAVIDGSPDTEYVFFESGTSSLGVVKYTSSATTISTSLSHTAGQPYSIIPMSGSILIQTSSATYSLNTSTDAITTLYSTSFNTRYPQAFTISPSVRTYNSNAAYLANSTIAVNYTPNTGSSAQTGVMIQTTTAPTLTAYAPSKYYYLTQNQLVVANSGSGNSWTISTVGSQNQFHVTPYSEHLSINLTQNSTLFGQNVFKLVCGSGEYTDSIPYFATGDYSDCTEWRILPSSSDTVGREIFIPFTTSPDLVHTSPMTAYTFTINSGTPTYYYIKSSYGGKVVDVATFDSSGQAQQRYLYGQCYTVSVTNTNSGQSALAGNICAGDSTTKPIDVNVVSVPVNWQGSSWAYNTYRNYTTPSSNTVTFTVDKNEHPWNASIHVVDNQFSTPTYDQWFNYTGQNAAQTITINGINGNQTLYFDGYENGVAVFNTVVSGQGFNLSGLGFTSLGSIFGIPIAGMFVIVIGGVFTRSSATFGFIAVLATIGVMVAFGLLNINPAFWAAMMGVAAVGIFAYKRLT